jgi:hypothetical protein
LGVVGGCWWLLAVVVAGVDVAGVDVAGVVDLHCHYIVQPKRCATMQQEGRVNKKTYAIFFDRFLPCVIKTIVFDHQVSDATTNDSTLCTVSAKVFVLLLLLR